MKIKNNACMKFYDVARPLYIETDESGVSFGTGLLQVRYGMKCRHAETLKNTILCLIAFISRSLLSTQWHYST